MKYLPKQFKFGLLLTNRFYYGALALGDFSVIRTGFISNDFPVEVPVAYFYSRKFVYSTKGVQSTFAKFNSILSGSGVYLFTLDKKTVMQIQSFSRQALAANGKIKKKLRTERNVVFESLKNEQMVIKVDIPHDPDSSTLGGARKATVTLDNVSCGQGFKLPCQSMKYLPKTDVEVRLGENGLVSFSSVTTDYDVHLTPNLQEGFDEKLWDELDFN